MKYLMCLFLSVVIVVGLCALSVYLIWFTFFPWMINLCGGASIPILGKIAIGGLIAFFGGVQIPIVIMIYGLLAAFAIGVKWG